MKMGAGSQYNSPTNFKKSGEDLISNSPMMMHKEGHDPKKGATVTSGKKGGFTQRTQGPVTGGVINTLDEVIITQPVNKKQSNSKKDKNNKLKPQVVYKSKAGKVIGDIFGKKKNKYGQNIIRKSSNSSLL